MQVPENSNNNEGPDFLNSEATKFVRKVNELLHRHNGHRLHIEYECAPVLCVFNAYSVNMDECFPFDCIGAFPQLKLLRLQFPSRSQVSRMLQHSGTFADLKEIMLCILTSWKKSIHFVAYLLRAAPLVETLKLEVHGILRPPDNMKIRWPKKFTHTSLNTIRIGGFSGESELMQLLFFLLRRSPVLKKLLIDTHQSHYRVWYRWWRETSENAARCNYAREVEQTHLAPNVPSTVKFSIM